MAQTTAFSLAYSDVRRTLGTYMINTNMVEVTMHLLSTIRQSIDQKWTFLSDSHASLVMTNRQFSTQRPPLLQISMHHPLIRQSISWLLRGFGP